MFSYCENNPVSHTDRDGRISTNYVNMADSGHYDHKKKSVKYEVPLYDQGKSNLCWAYCMVMRNSYRSGEILDKGTAYNEAKNLGIKYNGPFWDCGLSYFRLGLKTEINCIEDLHNAIYKFGPLYAAYTRDDNIFSGHIVLVTGVDLITGKIYTNNPWYYQGAQTYDDFMSGFLSSDTETISGYHFSGVYIPWC